MVIVVENIHPRDIILMGKKDYPQDKWESYSAYKPDMPYCSQERGRTSINQRRCYWGSEDCYSCLECVSGLEDWEENRAGPNI